MCIKMDLKEHVWTRTCHRLDPGGQRFTQPSFGLRKGNSGSEVGAVESTHRSPACWTFYFMQVGTQPEQTSMQRLHANTSAHVMQLASILGGGGGVRGNGNLGGKPRRLCNTSRLTHKHQGSGGLT